MEKVLLVGKNEALHAKLSKIATDNGHDVTIASNGNEAMEMIKASHNGFDRIITAVKMDDGDGIALLTWLYRTYGAASRPLTFIHSFYPEYEADGIVYVLPNYIERHFKGTVTVFTLEDREHIQATKFLKRSFSRDRKNLNGHYWP